MIECKCYTWTDGGNIPSAKLGFLNEAAFYLSFLSEECKKYIVMKKAEHPGREETLAEYYYRCYGHLLKRNNIQILEFDEVAEKMVNITEKFDNKKV